MSKPFLKSEQLEAYIFCKISEQKNFKSMSIGSSLVVDVEQKTWKRQVLND